MLRPNKNTGRTASPRSLRGFTLLEIAIVMAALGIVVGVILTLLPDLGEVQQRSADQALSTTVDQALLGHAVNKFRLPCPDANSDGVEDCTASDGSVPYKDLFLPAPALNDRRVALRYGVYRNSNATPALDANLTVNINRFVPWLAGSPPGAAATTPLTANVLDFCHALINAVAAADSVSFVNALDGASPVNMAAILASAGFIDANGNGSFFDGVNGTGLSFNSPRQAIDASYDDRVWTVIFLELADRLACAQHIGEANTMALASTATEGAAMIANTAVLLADQRLTQAEVTKTLAELQVALNAFQVAQAAFELALTIAEATELNPGAIASGIAAAAAVASAGAQLFIAASDLVAANNDVTTAQNNLAATQAYLAAANVEAAAVLSLALLAEAGGGLQ